MIFVTGASGLVGSFLVRKLIEKGHEIRALRRFNSDLSLVNDLRDRIEWVEGDLLDPMLLAESVMGAEAIFHCAALVSFDRNDKEMLEDVNVRGTENIVNAALHSGVPSLVHISSVAAIGRSGNSGIIAEDRKWEDSRLNTAYGISKYKAELHVWRAQEEGLNVIVVNPSVILGPADWNKTSTRIFKLAYKQNRFYTGGTMNYIDIRDLVDSTYELFRNQKFGSRYILSAGNISYKELLTKIAGGFNKRPPTIKANYWLLQTLVFLERIRSAIGGNTPVITPELGRISKTNLIYDNRKIREEIGIEFRSIEETVNWACREFINNLKYTGSA